MRWNVHEDGLVLSRRTRILVDGKEARYVWAFDTAEGWVDVCCTGQKEGHPGEPHMDGEDVCNVRLYGKVEVVPPGERTP